MTPPKAQYMPLRDYFAAKALASILTWEDRPTTKTGETFQDACARIAYTYADAMLKQREKSS